MGTKVEKCEVIKQIRALLDSSQSGLTAREIERDFRELIGKPLERIARALGFSDSEALLVDLSNDGICIKELNGSYLTFRAGAPDSATSHIQSMVAKQRPKTSARKGKSRPSSSSAFGYQRSISQPARKVLPQATQRNILDLVSGCNYPLGISSLMRTYQEKYGAMLNFRTPGFASLKEALSSIEALVMEDKKNTGNFILKVKSKSQPSPSSNVWSDSVYKQQSSVASLETDIRKVLEAVPDNTMLVGDFAEMYKKVIGTNIDPARYGYTNLLRLLDQMDKLVDLNLTPGTTECYVSLHKPRQSQSLTALPDRIEGLPKDVETNILQIISQHPDGVYMQNLDQLYKVEYGADLRPCNYGYPAMLELVYDLPRDLVDLLEGRFGPMLKPKSTEPTVKPITPGLAVKHSSADTMTSLYDAVGPGVQYNLPPTPPIHQYIEVILSHINNPSHFYMQVMVTPNTGKALEELMDLLEQAYNASEASGQYLLPSTLATPGQLVVCRYPNDNNWHRGRISLNIDQNFVNIFFVDYGTSCAVHKSQLYFLRNRFLALASQAQKASLYGVEPASEEGKWTTVASNTLLRLAKEKRLCARVMGYDKDQSISVCLTDTSDIVSGDVHINDFLVQSGFAQLCVDESQLPSSNISQLDRLANWSSDDSDSDEETSLSPSVGNAQTAPSVTQPYPNVDTKPVSSRATPPIQSDSLMVAVKDDGTRQVNYTSLEGAGDAGTVSVVNTVSDQMPSLETLAKTQAVRPFPVAPTSVAQAKRNNIVQRVSPQRQAVTQPVMPPQMIMPPLQHINCLQPPLQHPSNLSQHNHMFVRPPYYNNVLPNMPMYNTPRQMPYMYEGQPIRYQRPPMHPTYYNHQQPYGPSQQHYPQPHYMQQPTQQRPQQQDYNGDIGRPINRQVKSGDHPPPLETICQTSTIHHAVQNQSANKKASRSRQENPQNQEELERLRLKLMSLEFKQKRLLREQEAEFSGCESSSSSQDDELATVTEEIQHYRQLISQMGADSTALMPPAMLGRGRGRGRGLLIAALQE